MCASFPKRADTRAYTFYEFWGIAQRHCCVLASVHGTVAKDVAALHGTFIERTSIEIAALY